MKKPCAATEDSIPPYNRIIRVIIFAYKPMKGDMIMQVTEYKPYVEPKVPVYAVNLSCNPSEIDDQHIPYNTLCRIFADIEHARQYIRDAQAESIRTHEGCFATSRMQEAGLYMPPVGYIVNARVYETLAKRCNSEEIVIKANTTSVFREVIFSEDAVNPALTLDNSTPAHPSSYCYPEGMNIMRERVMNLLNEMHKRVPSTDSLYIDTANPPCAWQHFQSAFVVLKANDLNPENMLAFPVHPRGRIFTSIESAMQYACTKIDNPANLPAALCDAGLQANGVTHNVYMQHETELSTSFDNPCLIYPVCQAVHGDYDDGELLTSRQTSYMLPISAPITILKAYDTEDIAFVMPDKCTPQEYRDKLTQGITDFKQQVQYTLDCRGNEYMNVARARVGATFIAEPENAVKPEESLTLVNQWAKALIDNGYSMAAVNLVTRYDRNQGSMENMPALYQAISDTFREVQTQAVSKGDYKMATTAKTLVDATESQFAGDEARGDDNVMRDEVEEVLA